MRYTELPWPFEGWTVDEDGWIYTAAGYRTTAQRIEGACWLMQLHEFTKSMHGERLMFADTPLTEKRPRVYDWADVWIERGSDIKIRYPRQKLPTVRRDPPAIEFRKLAQ